MQIVVRHGRIDLENGVEARLKQLIAVVEVSASVE